MADRWSFLESTWLPLLRDLHHTVAVLDREESELKAAEEKKEEEEDRTAAAAAAAAVAAGETPRVSGKRDGIEEMGEGQGAAAAAAAAAR